MNLLNKIQKESYFKTLLYSLLLISLYFYSQQKMIQQWGGGDFTYCYLVPFIVFYLIWEKKDALLKAVSIPTWGGLAVLLAGLFFFWLGELGGEFYILFLSSWFV